MNAWNNYFYGQVASIRPFLLTKAVLVLLAVDAWVAMSRFGSQYGAAGFNVAHFEWLDVVQPLPSPALHTSLLLLAGMLAMMLAIAGTTRFALVLLLVLYTYCWSMSRLDSYTHHYLLSILLAALVFFPSIRATDIYAGPAGALGRRVSAWAYAMLGASVGIIFFYCAMAKVDFQWRAGYTLLSMGGPERIYGPIQQWLAPFGLSKAAFWQLLATSVIPLELAIAVGYVVAVRQDAVQTRAMRVGCLIAWLLAMVLHVGNEWLQLQIRWFSYYMMLLACVFLMPESWLVRLGRSIVWPARRWESIVSRCASRPRVGTSVLLECVAALAAALALALAGWLIDLPGGLAAGILAGAVAGGAVAIALLAGDRTRAWQRILAAGLAALCMWVAVTKSSARDHFYRFRGDDLILLGRPAAALVAYRKAERWMPIGAPRLAEVQNNIGSALESLGRHDEARQYYAQAVITNPHYGDAHLNLGKAWQAQGDTDQALVHYRQAVKSQADLAAAHYNLGNALLRLDRIGAAIEHYRLALRFNDDNADVHSNLGVALMLGKQFDEAIEHHRAAAMLRPADLQTRYNLGLACQSAGRLEEALRYYHEALDIDPGNSEVNAQVGDLLLARSELDKAIEHYRRALDSQPDSATVHGNIAIALARKGDMEEAIVFFRRAAQLDPEDEKTKRNLEKALRALGREE